MRTIRASEIGTFIFCRRAWWYHSQGVPSQNQAELTGGSAYHHRHGRQVIRTSLLRAAGWVILFLAVILLFAGLTLQFFD
ncbi:MAG: hypothetical protein IH586_04105 [Anaerolineaceae bacterium]|nr:hypothetical protein [Anaerolineaceae bacterium]